MAGKLNLKDLRAYKKAFILSNQVWSLVSKWDHFDKDTVGKQLVRSTDSIAANIAEGYGRFGKKDKIRFYHFSLGSLYEVQDWLDRAKIRGLIKIEEYDTLQEQLGDLPREINYLIKLTRVNLRD
ncbi:four helix bundle protein [Patescibacteria group bacterium]|nr:four helix bundle protein [Patescibacteria group bacterium]MBU1759175.1 four helix bundle protein [Patescibacteria group bacterium]MBU1907132.1 four helix bundle protein [Patescibacteria group bacterium]